MSNPGKITVWPTTDGDVAVEFGVPGIDGPAFLATMPIETALSLMSTLERAVHEIHSRGELGAMECKGTG